MPSGAIFTFWGDPQPGREKYAYEAFKKSQSYLDELTKGGEIEEHREFFPLVTSHRTMAVEVITGDIDRLLSLQTEPRFMEFRQQARILTHEPSVELWTGGSERAVRTQIDLAQKIVNQYGGPVR